MSTILDALKRSEQERKLNKVPTLSDMPAPQERSRWPITLVAVLVVSSLGLLFWIMLGGKPELVGSGQPATANEPVYVNSSADSPADPGAVKVSVITYAQEANSRFVIINGKIFREGEFVMAGVKVESIEQDSVILIERGKRITRKP